MSIALKSTPDIDYENYQGLKKGEIFVKYLLHGSTLYSQEPFCALNDLTSTIFPSHQAIKLLNRNGITSVCDARVYWQRGHDKIWKRLRRQSPKDFTIRAVMDLWAAPELEDYYQLNEIAKRYDDSDELLKFTGVKVCVHGLKYILSSQHLNSYFYHIQNVP